MNRSRYRSNGSKLQTDEGKAADVRHEWIAEPPDGCIESVHGFRQFSLRGLHRVQTEPKVVCPAFHLRHRGDMLAK